MTGLHRLPVRIVRSARRTICIVIDKDANIELRIPQKTTEREITDVLKLKTNWIIKKHREITKQLLSARDKQNTDRFTDRQRTLLEKRYRKSAADYFTLRVQHYESIMGVQHKKIVIRDQKTRWGSCSTTGTLSFNWRLMLAPSEVIDYVVVHELCHFRHMDHSKDFWACVESVMPDYRTHKQWLRDHGRELQL
jgi:predicted metal-dependent hydrolase